MIKSKTSFVQNKENGGLVVLCAIIVYYLFSTVGFAQMGIGIQAPLSLVGNLQVGPLLLETGLPIRFDLDNLATFANLKFQFNGWSMDNLAIYPYIGGGAKLTFSNLDAFSLYALAGVEVSVADNPLSVYGQVGIAPNFPTGLMESLALGVRFRF